MRSYSALPISFAVASLWLLGSGAPVHAQFQGSVTISNVASPGAGQISASGGYAVNAGWTVRQIALTAWPASGGAVTSNNANYAGGSWGPTTITGLYSGVRYNVMAVMVIQNAQFQTQTIQSTVSVVTTQ